MVGPKSNVAVVATTRHTAITAQAGGDSLLEWSQPFTEGPIHEPLPSNQREMTLHRKKNLKPLLQQKGRTKAKPMSKHTVFTHFPKDPNCESCKMTKTTRAGCQNRTVMSKIVSFFFFSTVWRSYDSGPQSFSVETVNQECNVGTQ